MSLETSEVFSRGLGFDFEEWADGGAFALEVGEMTLWIIGSAGLPDAEEDANPFAGQLTQSGMVPQATAALQAVVGAAPGAPLAGVIGEFVEGLPQELWAGAAAADRPFLATLLGDGILFRSCGCTP